MVSRRYFRMGHGIGRSGDIAAVQVGEDGGGRLDHVIQPPPSAQPKAAGSSLVLQTTNFLAKHALELAGLSEVKGCLCVPLATGMSISLCLQALHLSNPTKRIVLWCDR
jgi:O-phospho-L-seryl-tRNASec:L-selenocysteinyl-tRNA synthase